MRGRLRDDVPCTALVSGRGRAPEWLERTTIVVAAGRRELLYLVVRVGAEHDARAEVDALVGSFAVLRA